MMMPMIGILSISLSRARPKLRERFFACMKPTTVAMMMPKISHQYACINSDRLTTTRVKAGRSAPKLLNSSSNWGTTKISRIAVTMTATTMTAAG